MLETVFYLVIGILPSLAVMDMVSGSAGALGIQGCGRRVFGAALESDHFKYSVSALDSLGPFLLSALPHSPHTYPSTHMLVVGNI